ncbi:hypothetical protein GE107_18885 [Cohnella sp. CFH 77786]|uniref:transposase n=1 Tax=Cohnella sp. CFH 77786 TaxID=2662265 RepID=UPI001C610628|nr:transposase [Cohnella sp. CFH 77786]MBW5448127.1 hypothetical protein [Cohnella sp. CFH 77786]
MRDGLPFEAFCQQFDSDQACAEALFQARWPDGFRCPSCSYPHYYLIRSRRLPLYQCQACRHQTSVISGTVMEGSRTPLPQWFQAIYLLSQPEGISATRLAEIIHVTYKTAWLIAHKIRNSMRKADADELLKGHVRVERVDYGYHHYGDARQPLLIGGSIDASSKLRHVKIKQPHPDHVQNDSRFIREEGIRSFENEHLDRKAVTVIGRASNMFAPLRQMARRIFSWLNDTFQGIGAKHLQAYLDEYGFRTNLKLRGIAVFNRLIHWCAITKKIMYKEIIRSKPVLPVPWVVWGGKAKWRGRHLSLWNT